MVKFIEANRLGKEIKLNLRIGVLHAYPSGELQFENAKTADEEYDELDNEVSNVNNKRMVPR